MDGAVKITGPEWKQLFLFLDAYLELPEVDRPAFLARLERESPDLKVKLERLLTETAERDPEAQTIPPLVLGSGPLAAFHRQFHDQPFFAEGIEIGPYRLVREIGSGGMSTVWLAVRSDGQIRRNVALKLPHVFMRNAGYVERFAREREILSTLTHPHIARLYDAGVSAQGQPYLAMEYVEGTPLIEYCDSHRLVIDERAALFVQVLQAVQFAHTQLIIHRDIKPSNILVNAVGQVSLLDFGIAKLIVDGEARETELTQFGGRALTPDYASPEQILGQPLGTSSDVYSLGVVLYELMTGERPYRLKRDSRGALEEAILGADPPPAAAVVGAPQALRCATTLAKLRRTLVGDLGTVILKTLKKRPEERYATADALALDIERFRTNRPVLAQADSAAYRFRKFVVRNKLAVLTGGASLAAILIGAVGFAVEARNATMQRDRALALADRNEAVSQFLNDLVTQAGQSEVPLNVAGLMARSEALANLEYRTDPSQRAAVLDMLGTYYRLAGNPAKAAPLMEEALRAAEAGGSKDSSLSAKLHCDHAIAISSNVDQVQAARQELVRVIDDPDTDPLQVVNCTAFLGLIAQDLNKGPEALEHATRALALLRKQPRQPALLEATLMENLGWDNHLVGRNLEADRYYAAALAAYEAVGRGEGVEALAVRNDWAAVDSDAGDPRTALEQFDTALAILARIDPNAPAPAYLLSNRAGALERLGRYRESQTAYELCVQVAERAHDETVAINCRLGLSAIARATGDLPAAEQAYSRAVSAIEAAALPPRNTASIRRWSERGRLDLAEGKYAAAREHLATAMGDQLTTATAVASLESRAESFLLQGDLESALPDARRALALAQALQGGKPYSYRVGEAGFILGRVLFARGDAGGASKAFDAAADQLAHTVDPQQRQFVSLREWRQKLAQDSQPLNPAGAK